jgi:hypothetical protein
MTGPDGMAASSTEEQVPISRIEDYLARGQRPELPCRRCGRDFFPTREDLRLGSPHWWYCPACQAELDAAPIPPHAGAAGSRPRRAGSGPDEAASRGP